MTSRPDIITPHNEALMVAKMGHPGRVRQDHHQDWGIKPISPHDVVDYLYAPEWQQGSSQVQIISEALAKAGLGDFAQDLRVHTSRVIRGVVDLKHEKGEINWMDCGTGTGLSAEVPYLTLPKEVRDRVRLTLLDPSAESLDQAEQRMKGHGAKVQAIHDVDFRMLNHIEAGSLDIMTFVASEHHNSEVPHQVFLEALKPGGMAIFAEWNHELWYSPANVYHWFLKRMEWDQKEEALAHWLKVYPQAAREPILPRNPARRKALEQILQFWSGYIAILKEKGIPINELWPLEGHSVASDWLEDMVDGGFSIMSNNIQDLIDEDIIEDNPHQVQEDSTLNHIFVGQRPSQRRYRQGAA